MKKSFVFILAALLVVAFTMPASAFESVFGGYWRYRLSTYQDFTGATNGLHRTDQDTRTRLYYDAKFSDNFVFKNILQIDSTAGQADSSADDKGGKIGGQARVKLKHSYADFRTGGFRHTVGIQGAVLARGFLFDDDFMGYVGRYQPGTTAELLIPFAFINQNGSKAFGGSDQYTSYIPIYPIFPVGNMVFNPYFVYGWANGNKSPAGNDYEPWWLGIDWDMKADKFSIWASGIYSGGSGDINNPATAPAKPADNKGFLLAGGVDFSFGAAGLWVDLIYATGQSATATDNEAFNLPEGNSYYWAEIMGLGIFDLQAPTGAPGNHISNLSTIGVGLDLKTGDKLKWNFDLWYAMLTEKNAFGKDKLGTELDIVLNWSLVENITMDLVFAYLAAGDAVSATATGNNQEDPMEIGARLSFSF